MAEELLDLPMDLCMEILARLPAKSLMRFRCVCKSWCSLIDSSDFRLLHLQIYNRKHKYVLGKKYGECSIHSIDTFEKIDVFYETRRHCPVMGSCNGLILMFSLNKDNVDELVLYNPCIRKSVVIPRFPYTCIVRSSSSRYREDGRVVYWQGFAPSCNDYKVFVIQSFDFGIRVYSLNANRWRIKNRLNVSIPGILSLIRNGGRVLEFKGAIYWLGYDNPDNNPGPRKSLYDLNTHLVSLDFDSEKFKFVELPDAFKQTGVLQNCCFVLNESIAVFGMSSDRTCIWVLVDEGGGGKSWRLWYTGDSNLEALRFFRVGLCLQIFNVEKDTFYVFDFDRRLYSYNFKSHLIQHVENYVDEHNNLENYMESLILHNCTSKTKGRF